MAANNRLLGEVRPGTDIPPAPRGVPQIEVKFDIDQNGILNVSARDVGTGKEASVRIEQSSGLSKDEIDSMQKDAEEHAEEDRRQFELAEARNKGQHLVYQLEKQISENDDKLTDDDRAPAQRRHRKTEDGQRGEPTPKRSSRRRPNWNKSSSLRQDSLRKGWHCRCPHR